MVNVNIARSSRKKLGGIGQGRVARKGRWPEVEDNDGVAAKGVGERARGDVCHGDGAITTSLGTGAGGIIALYVTR